MRHHRHPLPWPVVKVGQEAVERWRKSLWGRPEASVVVVLAVGRSPAASAVAAAAAAAVVSAASVALASVEPVEFRTAADRRTPCRRSFVRNCWGAAAAAAAGRDREDHPPEAVSCAAGRRRSPQPGSHYCSCWVSTWPWHRWLLLLLRWASSVAPEFAAAAARPFDSSLDFDSMLRILAADIVVANCFHK